MNPKLIMLLWGYRREILGLLAGLLALLCVIGAAIASAFISGVPLVPDHLVPVYQREARELTAPDGTKLTGLDWHWLMVIDAVRFRQDWSQVTEESIHNLAQRFIKKIRHEREVCDTVTDPLTGWTYEDCHTEVYYTYERYSPEEVMAALTFSAEQMAQARAMLPHDISTEIGDCTGFVPNPASVYFWPVSGTITSCFGPRSDPVTGDSGYHYGVDIAIAEGTPIRAAHAGTVVTASYSGNYGNLVVITADGEDLHTWYGHMSGYAVTRGEHVEKGQVIGYVGSTGKSTGPHLHFETRRDTGTRPVNPITYYR
jgi:biotin carboxyl carrier protein